MVQPPDIPNRPWDDEEGEEEKMKDIFESEFFKTWEKKYNEEREIRCPFCGELQDNDDGAYPVTYHGEPEITEMKCQVCDKKFFVTENVTRTYEVFKEGENDR